MIQANQFIERSSSTALPIASALVAAPLLRVSMQPSAEDGLRKPSQVMMVKAVTLKRNELWPAFGRIEAATSAAAERCLAVLLGIAT